MGDRDDEEDAEIRWPAVDEDHSARAQSEAAGDPEEPAHAVPERVGASAHKGMNAQVPERRFRVGRRFVLTCLAVLLAVGMVIVLALPDVSNRLALPWAPNAPLGAEPAPVGMERSLFGPNESVSPATEQGVADALAPVIDDPALGDLSGSVIDPASGTVLWQQEAREPLPPASATKLLTTTAALLSMGPGARLSTSVVAGAEPGTVVLVGGGDPTLSVLPEDGNPVYPEAPRLDELVDQVKDASDREIDTVAVDLSAYAGETTAPGWGEDYVPSTYTAPIVAAMADGARADPQDRDSIRHTNPAGELIEAFAERLDAEVADPSVVQAPEGARVLGRVESAELRDLLRPVLGASDNVLAEALARQVAVREGEQPSFEGAAEATLAVLERNGFDTDGVQLEDGSGLSRDNRIPAGLLTEILAATAAPSGEGAQTGSLRPVLESLAVAGGSGTLAGRYDEDPAADARGWVRAKTGTLSEVNTLAGVVLDNEGRVLAFTMMSEGSQLHAGREALDAIAAALRGCGCAQN